MTSVDPSSELGALLRERFGVEEFPSDAAPFVEAARHEELARVLAGEHGYRIFVYVVASHWPEVPANPKKEGDTGDPEHYEVAYALRKPGPASSLATWRVRVEHGGAVQSLAPLFAGADWQEREQWDLVGVRFEGHPDLRRLMMSEDWEGHPLRRDYAIDTACPPWR